MDRQQVIEKIKNGPHQKVQVAITDLDGVQRGKYVHKDKFLSAIDGGFGFCDIIFGWDCADVTYEKNQFTGWHTGFPDANAKIDVLTFRQVPWNQNIPFFLADFVDQKGNGLELCPRNLLKRMIAQAERMGFQSKVGVEYEFFNFKETPQSWASKDFINPEPLTPGMFGYSLLRSSYNQGYFNALMDQMLAFDIPLEGLHTETGPGVYEAAILYSDPLTAADRGVLFKTAAKQIAYPLGIMPTFMAKFNSELPGCGGHIHQSLWANGKNVFFDSSKQHQMSDVFRQYLAGQMHCLPEILPLFAPTVNSYKRLVEGLWAPTTVTWGRDNRTTAFRALPGSDKSTRLETRICGADINAYLAVSAAIASGLYGIKNRLNLADEIRGNGYSSEQAVRLPNNLKDASDKFVNSELAMELFGETFVKHFGQTRLWEWDQFRQSVTNWELKRYFEII